MGSCAWGKHISLVIGFLACSANQHENSNICVKKVCEFTFVVHHTRTMLYHHPTKGAYDVQLQGKDLRTVENTLKRRPDEVIGRVVNASEVITADGYPRNIIMINGQFPGPTLEVMEGAQVGGVRQSYIKRNAAIVTMTMGLAR